MVEHMATTLKLKEKQLGHLDTMTKKYDLPDRSKALRCLIAFAAQETECETSIYTENRCVNC